MEKDEGLKSLKDWTIEEENRLDKEIQRRYSNNASLKADVEECLARANEKYPLKK